MTKYTAPQRTSRKRSLPRRARIILVASLLVPVSLLAIANVPASAVAKFTTLQDVQDAINAALAPINSAIASLQQTQTNQAAQLSSQQTAISNLQNTQATHTSQISALQNSSSKQVRAYDANGNEIGLLVNHGSAGNGSANDTIFSQALNRFIYLQAIEVPGNFFGFAIQTRAYFQSSDCTGTPYNNDPAAFNDILPYTPTTYYIVHYLEQPVAINSGSLGTWDASTNSLHCVPDSENVPQAYQLYPVTLPFPVPIAFPLQFKYQ